MSVNLMRSLTRYQAETHAEHPDHHLRGRTYAIPFERVWTAALRLAGGELKGLSVIDSDDRAGRITAQGRTLFGALDDLEIHITLDPNAQTRVDVRSSARKQRGDLGRNRRRLIRFLTGLDRGLGANPNEVLAHFNAPVDAPSDRPENPDGPAA